MDDRFATTGADLGISATTTANGGIAGHTAASASTTLTRPLRQTRRPSETAAGSSCERQRERNRDHSAALYNGGDRNLVNVSLPALLRPGLKSSTRLECINQSKLRSHTCAVALVYWSRDIAGATPTNPPWSEQNSRLMPRSRNKSRSLRRKRRRSTSPKTRRTAGTSTTTQSTLVIAFAAP